MRAQPSKMRKGRYPLQEYETHLALVAGLSESGVSTSPQASESGTAPLHVLYAASDEVSVQNVAFRSAKKRSFSERKTTVVPVGISSSRAQNNCFSPEIVIGETPRHRTRRVRRQLPELLRLGDGQHIAAFVLRVPGVALHDGEADLVLLE